MSDIKISFTISKVKLGAIVLLAILGIAAVCYAAIVSHQQVRNDVTVIGASTIVFTNDDGVLVEQISWGQIAKGLSKDLPATNFFKLDNIGSTDCFWKWNATLPDGMTLLFTRDTGALLDMNRYWLITPGDNPWAIKLRLSISSTAALGPQNFTLSIWNADSESG
jgi:hypothetical protein